MNTNKHTNIYIIGPMGAGKSSIGKILARLLKKTFFDTDHLIRQLTGVNIDWIFDVEGEAGIRKREQQVLEEITQQNDILISTGGGTILLPENRRILSQTGTIVYLKSNLQQQYERTKFNKHNRPSLRHHCVKEQLVKLSQERGPLYESIADFTFTTDKKSVTVVAKEVFQALLA